ILGQHTAAFGRARRQPGLRPATAVLGRRPPPARLRRRIPYEVAAKRGHVACAALLNPSSAEPLVWPSALKFISELEPDAKSLLEAALMEANRERERRILKGAKNALPSPSHPDDGAHDTAIAEASDA
uniref:Uncharacterized protein n=1 Tax=Zea mays TaxID=4577 RepID=A0A804UMS3_MAIZE